MTKIGPIIYNCSWRDASGKRFQAMKNQEGTFSIYADQDGMSFGY